MRIAVVAMTIFPLLSCGSVPKESMPDVTRTLYSVTIDENDMLNLSVYNPQDRSVCTSVLNWPSAPMFGDTLRVIGFDGQRWQYIGIEPMVVGKPQELKIAPQSEVTTQVDLRKYYKPAGTETRIKKVYYGALFHSC